VTRKCNYTYNRKFLSLRLIQLGKIALLQENNGGALQYYQQALE